MLAGATASDFPPAITYMLLMSMTQNLLYILLSSYPHIDAQARPRKISQRAKRMDKYRKQFQS